MLVDVVEIKEDAEMVEDEVVIGNASAGEDEAASVEVDEVVVESVVEVPVAGTVTKVILLNWRLLTWEVMEDTAGVVDVVVVEEDGVAVVPSSQSLSPGTAWVEFVPAFVGLSSQS